MESESFDNILDNIVKDNKIYRFVFQLEKTNIDDDRKKLKVILDKLQGIKTDVSNKMMKLYSRMEDATYNRKWYKLKSDQKKEKIKEFMNTIKIKNKKKIENKLFELIDTKKLKDKDIEFESGKIKCIKILDTI